MKSAPAFVLSLGLRLAAIAVIPSLLGDFVVASQVSIHELSILGRPLADLAVIGLLWAAGAWCRKLRWQGRFADWVAVGVFVAAAWNAGVWLAILANLIFQYCSGPVRDRASELPFLGLMARSCVVPVVAVLIAQGARLTRRAA